MSLPDCRVITGDALDHLPLQDPASIQCCITSPPYYGLRDYGHAGQIGNESTPEEYVARIVELGRAVRRVLKEDGTFWLNLGDCYYNYRPGGDGLNQHGLHVRNKSLPASTSRRSRRFAAFKEKDRMMIPARCAIAL